MAQSLDGSPVSVFSHAMTLATGGPHAPAARTGIVGVAPARRRTRREARANHAIATFPFRVTTRTAKFRATPSAQAQCLPGRMIGPPSGSVNLYPETAAEYRVSVPGARDTRVVAWGTCRSRSGAPTLGYSMVNITAPIDASSGTYVGISGAPLSPRSTRTRSMTLGAATACTELTATASRSRARLGISWSQTTTLDGSSIRGAVYTGRSPISMAAWLAMSGQAASGTTPVQLSGPDEILPQITRGRE